MFHPHSAAFASLLLLLLNICFSLGKRTDVPPPLSSFCLSASSSPQHLLFVGQKDRCSTPTQQLLPLCFFFSSTSAFRWAKGPMFHPHSAAFASLLLLLLNICFSSGKKSSKPDLPSESEWGSIESFDTSDVEKIIAKSKAKAKAKKQMASHGAIQAGHGNRNGPVVHHEIVGGGTNNKIDGGEGGEGEDVEAGNQPTKGKGAGAGGNETTEVE